MRKSQRRWLWVGGTVVVLGLIVYHLSRSPEWEDFRWGRFWSSLVHARPGFLLGALAATLLTYVVRAYRWRFFLAPLKTASLWVLFAGQVLGFSSIYLVGRAGEFVRPAYIASKEKVSFTSQLAILLLERIYDAVFLVVVFGTSLIFLPITPVSGRGKKVLSWMHWGGVVTFWVALLTVLAVVLYRLHTLKLTSWVLHAVRFLPSASRQSLEHFLLSFSDGLAVIQDWRDFLASLATTALLWVLNASVFWMVFQSLGGSLERLPWLATGLVLFCAAVGLAFQFPGIGGGYQVGIILALTAIFGLRAEEATGAAILIWILISVPCLALGLILLAREGLTFMKLRALAEEKRGSGHEVSVLRSRGR